MRISTKFDEQQSCQQQTKNHNCVIYCKISHNENCWYLMPTPVFTRQFDKDVKRMQKRGKKLEKIKIIIRFLIEEESLDPIHRDHKLIGNWQGRRECHIESDWLLIYKKEEGRVIFERTGTHSDLFQK